MKISGTLCARWVILLALPLHASVVGMNTPAESLTVARVMKLPAGERVPWLEYIRRSQQQMVVDKAALAAEREGLSTIPPLPAQGNSARAIPLHREAAYYASGEAKRLGNIIVSFQTPAGGWSKNLRMKEARQRGQSYAAANLAPVASPPGDFDEPLDETWHYVGTLDNDATNTELHFLVELSAALPGHDGDAYRASALRGFEYLLHSQFPNGGWPQVWPLEGGYHDAITFNDDAVTESAEVLQGVAAGKRQLVSAGDDEAAQTASARPMEDYAFVPPALRERARVAAAKALDIILKTQIPVATAAHNSQLTIWAQQFDPLTLKPVSARNFEMPALSSGESADVMEYLMSLPGPSPAVVRAVEGAAEWFEAHKILGYVWSGGRGTPGGRRLIAQPGAGPIWARYYSLTTGKPIFGDRDKTIHDDVREISLERRNGYAWFGEGPGQALQQYNGWKRSSH
jgi:hypothetical protein